MPLAAVRFAKPLELPEPGPQPGGRHLEGAQRLRKAVFVRGRPSLGSFKEQPKKRRGIAGRPGNERQCLLARERSADRLSSSRAPQETAPWIVGRVGTKVLGKKSHAFDDLPRRRGISDLR